MLTLSSGGRQGCLTPIVLSADVVFRLDPSALWQSMQVRCTAFRCPQLIPTRRALRSKRVNHRMGKTQRERTAPRDPAQI